MKGLIENREVIVLIDCRATQNFIVQKVVEEIEKKKKRNKNRRKKILKRSRRNLKEKMNK